MAIFNIPFFDDLEKKRRANDGKISPPPNSATPPINPDASIPAPNIGPASSPMPPTREARMPALDTAMSRTDEYTGAYDEAVGKKQPRWKSGLLGALRGFGEGLSTGGGLGAGIGGALAGGGMGAINPRALREAQFEQQVAPRLGRRWALEDRDRNRRMEDAKFAQEERFNQARISQMGVEMEESRARARKLGEPAPPKERQQEWKLGRNKVTGQFKWYDAADPTQSGEHDAYVKPDDYQPVLRVDNQGNYVDVKAAAAKGQPVKAFQKPKAAPKPKKEPKNIGISDVRAYAEEHGLTESQAVAKFANGGYTVRR